MWIFQLALLIVLIPLQYGPIGHFLVLYRGSPDLFVISVWAFSWFGDQKMALTWALMLGVAMDLLSFWPFGAWTAIWLVLTAVLLYLKRRFLDVSSVLEALLALVIGSVLVLSIEMIVSTQWSIETALIDVLTNCLLGVIVYYGLVMRYQLMARWKGKQL